MDWKFVPQFDSILMFGFAKPPAAGRTAGESNFSAAVCSSCKSIASQPHPPPGQLPIEALGRTPKLVFLRHAAEPLNFAPAGRSFAMLREWQGRKKTASTIFAWKPFD